MLEKFRNAKQNEIDRLRESGPAAPWGGQRLAFASALRKKGEIAVIAEYKRASPSQGLIREDLSPPVVARQYAAGGAAAISVLTEEQYFRGALAYLGAIHDATSGRMPLLRKDFIFDPLQVAATAATPASAILLIVRMLPDAARLRSLREQAEKYGMAAVVEIFDEKDLHLARESGAKLIQVNARDLHTLQVSRKACLDLIDAARPTSEEIWIAASGMAVREHLVDAKSAGFTAALIGTALMQAPHPGQALARLLGEESDAP